MLLWVALLSSASAQTNQLLRSETIAEFTDRKIHQANGVEVTVGEVNNSFFHRSDELATALTNAVQATGSVEAGWQTTSSY